jgi:type II secretory pathway pseudopilin PulG
MKRELKQRRLPAINSSFGGFTSIELLVVMAMLAVLTTMFFSALVRAKEKDIRVTCLNNEKQLYTSLHIYSDENGDKLPFLSGVSVWPWDIPASTTTAMLNSGCTKKTFYCPSTAPRFTDQQNWAAANSLWNFGLGNSFNIIGYTFALGGPGARIIPQYQNYKILSEFHTNGPAITQDNPATSELVPDVILSTGNILPATSADNYTSISGGFSQNGLNYPHVSAHVERGQLPAGGNIAYKDGHVQWKKFDASSANASANPTKVRTSSGPYFWW